MWVKRNQIYWVRNKQAYRKSNQRFTCANDKIITNTQRYYYFHVNSCDTLTMALSCLFSLFSSPCLWFVFLWNFYDISSLISFSRSLSLCLPFSLFFFLVWILMSVFSFFLSFILLCLLSNRFWITKQTNWLSSSIIISMFLFHLLRITHSDCTYFAIQYLSRNTVIVGIYRVHFICRFVISFLFRLLFFFSLSPWISFSFFAFLINCFVATVTQQKARSTLKNNIFVLFYSSSIFDFSSHSKCICFFFSFTSFEMHFEAIEWLNGKITQFSIVKHR